MHWKTKKRLIETLVSLKKRAFFYTKSHMMNYKQKVLDAILNSGKKMRLREVATLVGTSPSTVARWARYWAKLGYLGIDIVKGRMLVYSIV